MIEPAKRKIVFVIGAGASSDFGFPTGPELAISIRNRIDAEFQESFGRSSDSPLQRAFEASGDEGERAKAARVLRSGLGPSQSIDQFLFLRRTNKVVKELGMIALAEVILEAERLSQLSKFDVEDFEKSVAAQRATQNGWPVVLMDLLANEKQPHELDQILFQDIAFLIFNYDRCVEQLLFHHLRMRHDIPDDRSLEIVRSIPMLHIYGVLGDPFRGPVRFGASEVELGSVAKEIQTYHEDFTDSARQRAIDDLMRDAEKICFLGFGFLPANFVRLFPNNDVGRGQLWGTARGCEWSQSYQLAKATEGSVFEDCNPAQFLRTHGEALLTAPWFA
ncbi:MAG: hypothetical protein M3T55_01080 [Pseudomonadota bacterium]|nr:hypothetical protein [Pseudomonadota bacterium]